MNTKGRKVNFLIEDETYTDPKTGIEMKLDCFTVITDARMNKIIESVEGVRSVFNSLCETDYSVYVDKRYDFEFVKKEVEAALMCAFE